MGEQLIIPILMSKAYISDEDLRYVRVKEMYLKDFSADDCKILYILTIK